MARLREAAKGCQNISGTPPLKKKSSKQFLYDPVRQEGEGLPKVETAMATGPSE